MKRECLAAMLFAVATVGVTWAEGTNGPVAVAKAPAGGKPKLEFDRNVYDFGTTSQVESVTGTFTFHNAGDGELKIQRAVPSCGCTVASVKPDVLKPGQKGELIFTVRLGGARGHLEKHINVPSNDPQNPNINLAIKANVVQVVEVSPSQLIAGDLRPGATTNLTILVRRTDGKKLSITNTETSNKSVRARVEPGDNDQTAKVNVEITGEGVPRRFAEQVRLFMDGAAQPTSTISVLGRVLGDVNVTPEALFWGITDPQHWPGSYPEAMITRQIVIAATQPVKPLEVQNVTSSVKEVSLELVPVETGKTDRLMARLGEVPKESTRGTISFDTNIPSQPKVVVPVTINVLRR